MARATSIPTRVADVPLVVGVTGHRNLVPGEIDALRERVRAFFLQLRGDYPDLPLVVLSSLAEGADQLVAREALACGARLVAPLPLAASAYVDDFTDPRVRDEFAELLRQAELLQLPVLPDSSPEAIATPGLARERQYAQAGVFVASHSHILLALWDGREPGLLGGTGQVVRYALDGVMPGLVEQRAGTHASLDPIDESLVFHVACSRVEGGDVLPPAAPLLPAQARWLSQKHDGAPGAAMPDGFRRMFARMQGFDRDRRQLVGRARAPRLRGSGSAASIVAGAPPTGDEVLDGLLGAADTLAMHFQARVLMTMRAIHLLAVMTGIALLAYSDLPIDATTRSLAITGFIALFAAGGLLASVARRRGWHRKYVDYRALAEGLRVQRWWRRAGIVAAGPSAFAHEDFMQEQDLELGWIRNVMRAASIAGADDAPVADAALDAAIADFVGAPGQGGQLDYYARKSAQRRRMHARAQGMVRACLWTGIAIAACLAVFQRWLTPGFANAMVVAMGVLAILAAARESYAFRKGDKELAKQYGYMLGLFTEARRQLDATRDCEARRGILRVLGEAALAEHSRWALLHRERPLENTRF